MERLSSTVVPRSARVTGFDVGGDVSMSTLSHHLKVLREAGVIHVKQKGSFRQHELRSAELEQLFPGVLKGVVATFGLSLPEEAPRELAGAR